MNITKKIFIGFILTFTFTLLFNQIFNLSQLMFIFPDGAFNYPRPKTVNNGYVFFLKFLLVAIIPIGLSVFFILKTKLLDRLTKNWGLTLLTITVGIYLARYGLIFSDGSIFAWVYLFSNLIPLNIMLTTGLLKILLSLTQGPDECQYFKSERFGLFVLTLGLGAILPMIMNLSLITALMNLLRFSSNELFIPIFLNILDITVNSAIALIIIYKTKLYKKIANNYSFYLLGISASIYYVNSFLFICILKYPFSFFSDFIYYYLIFHLLIIFSLIISFLNICLTLKPLETEQ